MILFKDVMKKYIIKYRNKKEEYKFNNMSFWNQNLIYISDLSLLEQILVYDLVLNMHYLKVNKYPDEVYKASGMGYLRPDRADSIFLLFFNGLEICLFENLINRKDNINVASMALSVGGKINNKGNIFFENHIFSGIQDFILEKSAECLKPFRDSFGNYIDNASRFSILKFSEHVYNNWDCFKECIFPEYLLEFPSDWDNYPKNKIILMLKHMLKTE